jgi:DNA-binding transcriptional LysR family regulator
VAFVELPIPDGSLECMRLLDDPFVLIVPEDHELTSLDRPITLGELAELPLIGFKCRTSTRVVETFRTHGLSVRFGHRVEDGGTLLGLVLARLGVGLVPRLAADIEGKPLVAIPVEAKLAPRIVAIAWHRDRLRTCTAGLFIDLAVEVAAGIETSVAA